MIKTKQELIERPNDLRPHVVLLGAGASKAAFPAGDAAGLALPVMDELIDVVGLQSLVKKSGIEREEEMNFEAIYSRLASDPKYEKLVMEIEERIDRYFSNLSLPGTATIYDQLLLSLRSKDAVFTFNWDPFLFDAYERNSGVVSLPKIFFLHGNVRVGACLEHDTWGARKERCPECCQQFVDVPLLFPIEQKDYSKDSYIRQNWDIAKELFRDAFTLTIFGYGAPESDKDAVELLRLAWIDQSDRTVEHVEIIDIVDESILHKRWSPFTPTHHYQILSTFEKSRLARWPRRSCESLLYPMTQGIPCEDFPLPTTDSLSTLQTFSAGIAQYEEE